MNNDELKAHILRHEALIAANTEATKGVKEAALQNLRENREQHSELGESIDDVRDGVTELREKLIYQKGFHHFLKKLRFWPLMIGAAIGSISYGWKQAHDLIHKIWN